MSVAAGLSLAFLKMGAIALVIMVGVWLIVRSVEKKGREKSDANKR